MNDRPNYVPEIKAALSDPRAVLEALGIFGDGRAHLRQAAGWIVRCVVHDDRTPSMSVQFKDGELKWKCHGCQAAGDVLALVAAVRRLNTGRDFPKVLIEAARLANLWPIVDALEGRGSYAPTRIAPPRMLQERVSEERCYPDGVALFWRGLEPVSADGGVGGYLSGRAIDPDRVAAADLARELPTAGALPVWARCRGGSWREASYRLIVPVFDDSGEMRSVRGWRVGGDASLPKRIPPWGHKASGLVMADAFGLAMLRGDRQPKRVVVAEGEPDFLTWASRLNDPSTATLGIVSGSWTDGFAMRIPVGCRVDVRTDNDEAGARYLAEIEQSLRWRCGVFLIDRSAA